MNSSNPKSNQFKSFLKANEDKIRRITPRDLIISKDDEWANETTWDNDYKERFPDNEAKHEKK